MENSNTIATKALTQALDLVEHTDMSIFLTGKAGTGKTTFLRKVVETTSKTCAVVAPTGVAAINARGVTIHSFFQISPAPYVPGAKLDSHFNMSKRKLRIIKALDLLIIDEISMVRADLLDAVDNALRSYRHNSKPFGGVQLLMIGDLHQLAPVVTQSDEAILKTHYSTPYFFSARALEKTKYLTISLDHVFRQSDPRFVSLLNNVRNNTLTQNDIEILSSRVNPTFKPDKNEGYIRLTTHNHQADSYNNMQMQQLASPPLTYRALVKGTFPEQLYPTAMELALKKGAQVMFIKNDPSPDHEYYNGLIGTITDICPEYVVVHTTGEDKYITVLPQLWENVRYTVNEATATIETEVQGTFMQMPLRPAWAITIHKSQGLTFDKVVIDAGSSFAPGQVYVALSRCRTLQGMVLATPISQSSLYIDNAVTDYMELATEAGREAITSIQLMKQEYVRRQIVSLFDFSVITSDADALNRLIYTNFRSLNPELAVEMERVVARTKSEVFDVALKWRDMIENLSVEQLFTAPFMERIQRSAGYFGDKLKEIYSRIFNMKVQSDNKRASERGAEIAEDLRRNVSVAVECLNAVSQSGFTVDLYLKTRQKAFLKNSASPADVARAKAKAQRGNRQKEREKAKEERAKAKAEKRAAKAKEKKPAGETYNVTLRLFRQGLNREEIAAMRGLTPSTINSHLNRFIKSGEIKITDILEPGQIKRISDALQQFHEKVDWDRMVELLPDVSRHDMYLVYQAHK